MSDCMKIAIIGGGGKMGRWFARFLSQEGHEVVISGRSESKLLETQREFGVKVASNTGAVENANLIVISVPIESFEGVVREISPYLRPGQKVVDVTSTKVAPVEIMHRHIKTALVLGIHPLFGPGAKSVSGQNFILTPTDEREQNFAGKVKSYLEERGARVSLMTPDEHDEKMTVVLGLSHFIAIVAADTLLSEDRHQKTETVGGITYKVLLTLVESVVSEDAGLYASLQMNLPDLTAVEAQFLEKASAWAELVKNKDRKQFIQRMTALREKLERADPDFGKAYENMYRIVSGL